MALLGATPGLAAQSNEERVLNGWYTPSHDFDLLHQRIEVRDFDWDSTSFTGRVVTTLVSLRPGLDTVRLDMDRQLEVRSVTASGGAGLRFERPGDTLAVLLPRPAGFGDTVRFAIDYLGRIEQGRGLYFFKQEPGLDHRPEQVYSGGGTDGNPRWIPTWGAPNDKETWELLATVPRRLTVVSNGRLVRDRPAPGGMHTVHWQQEQPASTYLISLVAAPLAKITDRWRGRPVEYYVYREDSTRARQVFGVTPDMMETFSRLTGVPFPWPRYAQTTVADFIGGMENVGATTLVDWLPDARAYQDRPWYLQSLIPHELAHQWFGNLVTAENWANYWLNEGMAEFMPGQYWGAKMGARAEEDYYLAEYGEFITRDARRRTPLASWNSNNVYPKGALVLEMLKQQLGAEPFWAAIHLYLTRHAYGTATGDDLRQAVLDATGQSLEWFWSQWIYRAGYPEFAVTAAFDSAAGALSLTVRQTQRDTAAADSSGFRFTTPEVFRAPVAIRVGTANGDVVARTTIDRQEQTIRIEGLRGAPTMVIFDDENAVVKGLTFDQPTPWLTNQLARTDRLWSRFWAIEQLSRRTADTAAGVALARAARGADYFRTRAQAAAALASFPAAVALPALADAARDTSAQVREAAVGALAGVGGDRAFALARAAWSGDPSYAVRAAALTALARLSPGGARQAVLAGLGTSSYRDVIQNAAIVAVVHHPDPGLVRAVARLAGAQPLPTTALAVLAARGDTTARTALIGSIDDARAWVRGWAIAAVEEQLGRADALSQLRALLPGIRRPEARAAVSEAITRLERRPAG
ncbi:MAG TPA: M1 family aminopeptidase [Gemmatimonadales bacterium]|nr:M1 family aminopeptidase [Gemmatimonadales bacterium]